VVTAGTRPQRKETATITRPLQGAFYCVERRRAAHFGEQNPFVTDLEYDDAALKSIGVDRGVIRLALAHANESSQVVEDPGPRPEHRLGRATQRD
jgi:hypothetical protein